MFPERPLTATSDLMATTKKSEYYFIYLRLPIANRD